MIADELRHLLAANADGKVNDAKWDTTSSEVLGHTYYVIMLVCVYCVCVCVCVYVCVRVRVCVSARARA